MVMDLAAFFRSFGVIETGVVLLAEMGRDSQGIRERYYARNFLILLFGLVRTPPSPPLFREPGRSRRMTTRS